MDLAARRPLLAGRNQSVRRDPVHATGESTARVPNSPQLRPSSRSGSVSQPLLRMRDAMSFRLDLASGLLSRAMPGGDERWLF
jgi:hypothetical protein